MNSGGGIVIPGVVGDGSGFNFDLCKRNNLLETRGVKGPKNLKTGTTIVGVLFDGGVIVASDTRSTAGDIVADKNCLKTHHIAENIYACGAGTAADLEHVTAMIASHLKLHRYATGRKPRVITAVTLMKSHLFRYQGHVGAALIVGGYDFNGPHLFSVHPHGSVHSEPFTAMGSGSLNALGALETGYKDHMSREEAELLAARAIKYGIYNDLGSGSNVDLCVITKDGVDLKRNVEVLTGRLYQRQFLIDFKSQPAPVIKEKQLVSLDDLVVEDTEPEAMDTT